MAVQERLVSAEEFDAFVMRPENRIVFRPGQPAQTLDINGTLEGGNILPGFSLPVKDIFPKE
ncbi:MAG: hypothetical protein HZC41_10120 [Chloroflexi bacterium]|nr:hypothetical protein [Chloroflexota bacterium]